MIYFITFLFILKFLFYKKFIPSFVTPKSSFSYIILKYLILLTWILIIISYFNININTKEEKKTVYNTNIQIIFDVSLSMSAKDIPPNRFEFAKNQLIKLISKLEWYNISIIYFSWIPFIDIPFSRNNKAIIEKIKQTKYTYFPPTLDFVWTAIWDSILLWIDNIIRNQPWTIYPWVILLITDWDSNKWIDPYQAAEIAKKLNIPIYSIAIWNSNYIIWIDTYWIEVPTTFNPQFLHEISKITWWKTFKVENEKDFNNFINEFIKNLPKNKKEIIIWSWLNLNKFLYLIISIFLIIIILLNLKIIYESNIYKR